MKNKQIEVVQRDEKPVPAKVMAESIVKIGEAMKTISRTRLKRDTVILLVAHKTKIAQYQVADVIDCLENLERDWLK